MSEAREAIRAENIVKSFGHIVALNGVSMQVSRGETLGILGDNGAGKSTLIKILTGYHQPDSGQVYVDGAPVQLGSVDAARALGIECVYQDLALVNGLSIYHNMFLKRELLRAGPLKLLDHKTMRRRAAEALEEIGVAVPSVELEVGQLSGGQRRPVRQDAGRGDDSHRTATAPTHARGPPPGALVERVCRAPTRDQSGQERAAASRPSAPARGRRATLAHPGARGCAAGVGSRDPPEYMSPAHHAGGRD